MNDLTLLSKEEVDRVDNESSQPEHRDRETDKSEIAMSTKGKRHGK